MRRQLSTYEYISELVLWYLTYLLTERHTYLLTYLVHGRFLLEKLTGSQIVKKFPAYYWTWRFVTEFTSARHLFLSSASSIQYMPLHPTCWRSILILPSHLRLGLPSDSFPHIFPPIPCIRLSSPSYVLQAQTISFFSIWSSEQYRSLNSSSCSFLHSPVTSSLLSPNILLNTLFSSTLSLRSSLNVSDQVSHPSCMIENYKLLTLISTAHFHTRNRTCCYRHEVTSTASLRTVSVSVTCQWL